MIPGQHGAWCNAHTYKTTCPDCKNTVFVFQCDCNSKVFFDRLGPPWPKHHCDGYGSERSTITLNLGSLTREQLDKLASLEEETGALDIDVNEGETVFDTLQRLAEEERLRDAMQIDIRSAQSLAEESANKIISRMSERQFSVPENLDVTIQVYWDNDTMSWSQSTRVKQKNLKDHDTVEKQPKAASLTIADNTEREPIKNDTFWINGSNERSVTFTKPIAFKLGKKRYEVSSWKGLLARLCQILSIPNPNDKMEMNAEQIRRFAVYYARRGGYKKNKISFQLRDVS